MSDQRLGAIHREFYEDLLRMVDAVENELRKVKQELGKLRESNEDRWRLVNDRGAREG